MKLVILSLIVSACASEPTVTPSFSAACLRTPSKLVDNACLPYAHELAPLLKQAGATNVHILAYDWKNGGKIGAHAIVLYTDSAGNWVADNDHRQPLFSIKDTMEQRAQWFSRPANIVMRFDLKQ